VNWSHLTWKDTGVFSVVNTVVEFCREVLYMCYITVLSIADI
jgi:hypothetical protein